MDNHHVQQTHHQVQVKAQAKPSFVCTTNLMRLAFALGVAKKTNNVDLINSANKAHADYLNQCLTFYKENPVPNHLAHPAVEDAPANERISSRVMRMRG